MPPASVNIWGAVYGEGRRGRRQTGRYKRDASCTLSLSLPLLLFISIIYDPRTPSPRYHRIPHILSAFVFSSRLFVISSPFNTIFLYSPCVRLPCRDNCSNVRESELLALFATISPRYGGIAATTLLIVSIVRHLIRSPQLTLAIIGICICGSINYTFRFTRRRLSLSLLNGRE